MRTRTKDPRVTASAGTSSVPWRGVRLYGVRMKSERPFPAALFLVLFFVSVMPVSVLAAKKPSATPSVPEPVKEKVFSPKDFSGLKTQMSRRVVVQGTIVGMGESKTKAVRYLNFTKNYRDSVSLVFFARSGDGAFTKEKLATFVGKKVRVGGLLSEYHGALQIKVEAPEHIKVLN